MHTTGSFKMEMEAVLPPLGYCPPSTYRHARTHTLTHTHTVHFGEPFNAKDAAASCVHIN